MKNKDFSNWAADIKEAGEIKSIQETNFQEEKRR